MRAKDDVIRFRCNGEQRKVISKAAAAVGMTLSGYILFVLGEHAGDELGKAILQAKDSRNKTTVSPSD